MEIKAQDNELFVSSLEPIRLTFDYQSNSAGQILLMMGNNIVECEPIVPIEAYTHIAWVLEEKKSYRLKICFDGSVSIKNGWLYRGDVLAKGAYCFESDNNKFSIHHSLNQQAQYSHPQRLQFHFSAQNGWINDPNGLVYHGGWFHLFYQYYPYAAYWGNMHWGHAVSKDLIHWQHLPIAIYPSEKLNRRYIGGAFSGSGLSKNNKLYLAYTEHFEDLENSPDIFIEKQKLIESNNAVDFGDTKTLIDNVPENCTYDFRDPKIWFDDVYQCYYMVIGTFAEGYPSVALYQSNDLKTWAYHSILFQEKTIPGRTLECPNLFKIDNQYVLILSIFETLNGENCHYQTYYYLGGFDGKHFISQTEPRRLDFADDNYAMQVFSDEGGQYYGIGWMNSWEDKSFINRYDFAGAMTVARKLFIESNQLCQLPVEHYKKLRSSKEPLFLLSSTDNLYRSSSRLIELNITSQIDEDWDLLLYPSQNGQVKLKYENKRLQLINELDRDKQFTSSPYLVEDQLKLIILVDTSSIEVFTQDGKVSGTMRFCAEGELTVKLHSDKNNSCMAKIWELNSIWQDKNNQ